MKKRIGIGLLIVFAAISQFAGCPQESEDENNGVDNSIPAPDGLTAEAVGLGGGEVKLSWNAVSGADSYEIEYKKPSWNEAHSKVSGTTSITFVTLTLMSTAETGGYFVFKVRALQGSKQGPWSEEVGATILLEW